MTIRFDGQAAIVTGAGGGLGFSIARELVRRGCAVLVNDYGGNTAGVGASPQRVEQAAASLREAGGKAVADATAVGTPEAARSIVAHALEVFGRVDILVNNAGIARPMAIDEGTDDNLELEMRTNLLGPYALMRAVWSTMKSQSYGRVVNVSSNASLGIGHNTSYATAKAGLIGLTMDSACEGRAHGILVNALMPVAYTRMIKGIPDPNFVAWFRRHMAPEKIAAPLAYFLSRNSTTSGIILSAGGGRMARVSFAANGGVTNIADAESAASSLSEIIDLERVHALESSFEELGQYTRTFPFEGAGAGPVLDESAMVRAGRTHDK